MKMVLASNNKGKIAEFRAMLGDGIVTPRELGLQFDAEETGATFFDNALIKAKALYDICGIPALADDSGLCVDALGGAPGVYSARYSGEGDEGNINKLLSTLNGEQNRKAHFTCCIVYYDGAQAISAVGECHGTIATEKHGNNGFGYDPIFISEELGKTFAESSSAEKNAISHRARALYSMKEKLGI